MSDPSFPIELPPDSEELLENVREQELGETELVPLQEFYSSIVESGQIKFRRNLKTQIRPYQVPELEFDSGESESDEEPSTPHDPMNRAAWLFADFGQKPKRQAVLGGATVTNVALVIPDNSGERFGKLPVIPVKGTGQISSQLIAAVPNEKTKENFRSGALPLLILGDEEAPASVSGKLTDASRIATSSALLADSKRLVAKGETQQDLKDEVEPGKGTDTKPNKTAAGDIESFVLSGDIANLFGIKGLKGKLYKFKGECQGQCHPK